ncbi:hypothetical protein [Oerskovia enterophila]|uniref:Uncharacterized protein n=1 Tax=Oerskovia enterophila TaxID=43678 RepID=A0ABX2Y8P7_9CELL|nr:hypothetical protein [Oerskovia enterophila]OCI32806.1 hypothetical protein OERS_03980 [Oerskovia enterophila]
MTIEPGDRAFIAASRTDHSVMSAALRAVLDLHEVVPAVAGLFTDHCRTCRTPYPCTTVTAVATALEGSAS